ncbi:MAG TPA: glutaredoxin domain-containing protein [Acidimicrobiia bacterium]|nr:glutaredoxin domain-containing protein [Acidimicrobiia bacterium]HLE39491.1 glutaredoxin domain-containing protein [Acidimicrobiia bacterium]
MTGTAPIEVTLVTASGCHFCEDATRLLEDLGRSVPLAVRVVSLTSEEGRELAVRHRVPFPPILIIDGVLFGHGRISRRKLERRLGELTGAEVAVE